MKSKILKCLSALAFFILLCGMLTACGLSDINIGDMLDQVVGDLPEGTEDEENNDEKNETEKEEEKEDVSGDNTGDSGDGNPDEEESKSSPFTPSIGANGNWFIGSVDLGIHSQAVPPRGVGIQEITLSSTGAELVITYTDKSLTILPLPEAKTPCASCENTAAYPLKSHPHTAAYNANTAVWSFTPGKALQICNTCGSFGLTNSLKHVWSASQVVKPTCMAEGYTKVICGTCSYYEVVEGSQTEKGDHGFAPPEGTQMPPQSCTEGYYVLGVCTEKDCTASQYIYVEPKGHVVSVWTKNIAPTLTTEGSLIGACTACNGTVVSRTLPALNAIDYIYASEEVTCLSGGEATYTYTVKETAQTFVYKATIPPASHVVSGTLVKDMKQVNGAIVYGQTGIKIFSLTAPKCGEIVDGFYTCDVCEVHVTTKVAGDHTWGTPTYQQASCLQAGMTVRRCTVSGCSGRSEQITQAILPHSMTYTLIYDAESEAFLFGKACETCTTKTETSAVAPSYDAENSRAPQCNAAGYRLYVYTFLEDGVEKSVSCKVEYGAATGQHTFIVDDTVILPDEITPGVFAYSSKWVGKGLSVLAIMGQPEPSRETCGLVYDGFYECVCGAGYISVKIYNPHELVHDPSHAENKIPTATENGISVFVCTKADCDHVELIEIEKTEE